MNDPQRDAARKIIRQVNPARSAGFWWAVMACFAVALLFTLVVTIGPALSRQSGQIERQGQQIARQNTQLDDQSKTISDLQSQLNCRAGSSVDLDTAQASVLSDIVAYLALPTEPADIKQAAIEKAVADNVVLTDAATARQAVIDACRQPGDGTPPATPGDSTP